MARHACRLRGLKAGPWGGFAGYDRWFASANNASFGVLAAYNDLVPGFEALFEREGRDFRALLRRGRRLAALPEDQRRATLVPLPQRHPENAACPTSASIASSSAWPRRARSPGSGPSRRAELRHGVHRIEGETSDTVEFTRSGVNGTLIVAADHFDLNAKLGFLLGAFSETIEGEIERNLDELLAAGAPEGPRGEVEAGREEEVSAMATSLLALLDDIATILDDVAVHHQDRRQEDRRRPRRRPRPQRAAGSRRQGQSRAARGLGGGQGLAAQQADPRACGARHQRASRPGW